MELLGQWGPKLFKINAPNQKSPSPSSEPPAIVPRVIIYNWLKSLWGVFSPSFFPLLSPSPPTKKKKEKGGNYLRRWRCSQTIILAYSNNRNLQNSNHNSWDRGGINQSCRFNSVLNIDEMCFGSLTLAWQGQGSRLEAPGRWREGWGAAAGRRGFCDSNWWLSGQVESERGSEEGC